MFCEMSDPLTFRDSSWKILIEDILNRQRHISHLHEILISGVNNEQRTIYNSLMEAISSESGGKFFVYGHRGTGKTYLYRTIFATVRSKGKIALTVASSGIVALLLPGDRKHIQDSTSRLMSMRSQTVK